MDPINIYIHTYTCARTPLPGDNAGSGVLARHRHVHIRHHYHDESPDYYGIIYSTLLSYRGTAELTINYNDDARRINSVRSHTRW